MHYSTHVPRGNINYKSIGFSLSEVKKEDSWLVDFMPSLIERQKFLKYKDYWGQHKAYDTDGMNGFGKNVKRKPPDMMEYWNFYLTDEVVTTTRNKYTWLDNCAFIGGNIDFILMNIGIFFSLYTYKIADFETYYMLQKSKVAKGEGFSSQRRKMLEKYYSSISLHMLITDVRSLLLEFCCCCRSSSKT